MINRRAFPVNDRYESMEEHHILLRKQRKMKRCTELQDMVDSFAKQS
jgi:hypothetical protein